MTTISIITPSLNRRPFISRAIESVLRQNIQEVEHIVVDGGSTDGTLELLNQHPHLRVISEPDQGIYDALNKGVGIAQGEVIGFMNTDDLYEPGIFSPVSHEFTNDPQIEAVSGGASIFSLSPRGEREVLSVFPGIAPRSLLLRATQGAPVFNAWFFRKSLLEELGGFDLRYRYVADRDLLIRMAFRGSPYRCLDRLVYHYQMHPGSYTLSGQDSGEAAYMFEARLLAENYLYDPRTARQAKRSFRTWHSQITVEQIRTAVHKKAYLRAFRYVLAGLRHNPGWPLVFIRVFIDRLPYIIEGFSRRSPD